MIDEMTELAAMVSYDRDTGAFTWLVTRPGGRAYAGMPAGSVACRGYVQINLRKKKVLAHRLAWFMDTGSCPADKLVEHINGIKTDNRIANLRLATTSENAQNLSRKRKSISGLIGVSPASDGKRWVAQIQAAGRKRYIGTFDTVEEAHAAYCSEKAVHHTFQPEPRDMPV